MCVCECFVGEETNQVKIEEKRIEKKENIIEFYGAVQS